MGKRRPSGDGMVRKREDGRWEGRIVIGHKDNGEPIFRYVSAKTQKDLLKKLHQNIEEYRDVNLCEGSKMSLREWLDRWLEEYAAPSVRASTLEGYRGYPDGVSPKKKAIAAYLRENPGVTSKSRIARELHMDRSTVQKYYDEIRSEIREGNVRAS